MGAWGSRLQHGGRSSVAAIAAASGAVNAFSGSRLSDICNDLSAYQWAGEHQCSIWYRFLRFYVCTNYSSALTDVWSKAPQRNEPDGGWVGPSVYLQYISSSAQNLISICRCLGVCTLYHSLSLYIYIYVHTRVFMSQYNILKAELRGLTNQGFWWDLISVWYVFNAAQDSG